MDINLQYPNDGDLKYVTPAVGEDVVFHFTTTGANAMLSVGYGPTGSQMQRSFHMKSGTAADFTAKGQQVALHIKIGPSQTIPGTTPPMVITQGYDANTPSTLTVNTPQPADGRTTQMYYQMKPAS